MSIRIGDLTTATGVKPRTIRFYEAKGLLPPPRRSEAGYRLYEQQDVQLLSLIRSARSLGLSIQDVGELVMATQHESCGSFQGKAARLIVAKMEQVEWKILEMTTLKRELKRAMQNLAIPAAGRDSGVLECTDCRCLGNV